MGEKFCFVAKRARIMRLYYIMVFNFLILFIGPTPQSSARGLLLEIILAFVNF